MKSPSNTDAIEALIVYLMHKLGLEKVAISDVLIAAINAQSSVAVERNQTIKVATFTIKERD